MPTSKSFDLSKGLERGLVILIKGAQPHAQHIRGLGESAVRMCSLYSHICIARHVKTAIFRGTPRYSHSMPRERKIAKSYMFDR
jgi:hypothetical protein